MQLTGGEIVVACLKEQGVDTVFGYPGGTILNIYDALYKHSSEINHILTSHEQGAAHAADGYARSTGKVGVCFATSGPGATNLTTGIATAYMDSSPVVFITCNVAEPLLGKDSFQEVDITGIAMPITKATYLVRDPSTIPDVMRQAFAVAATGRPGPVLIDFLKNVTAPDVEIDYEFVHWKDNRSSGSIRDLSTSHDLKAPKPNSDDIDILVDMISVENTGLDLSTQPSVVLFIGVNELPTKATPYAEGMNWVVIALFCLVPIPWLWKVFSCRPKFNNDEYKMVDFL